MLGLFKVKKYCIVFFFSLFISCWQQLANAAEDHAALVINSNGDVTATDSSGNKRSLSRKMHIFVNDTITAGENAMAQIRFTDGGLISIQAKTKFKINEYHYQQADPKNKNSISLLEGGFRTVTGAIGKENPQNVTYKTSVATIGVRGTDTLEFITAQQEYVQVKKGRIIFNLDAGMCSQELGENESVVLNKKTLQFVEVAKNDPVFTSMTVNLPTQKEIETVLATESKI